MGVEKEIETKMPSPDKDTICTLLDKLTLQQLHLMEAKMQAELNIESSIKTGTIHLAKSRYIMGQNSVSSMRLPMENSSEFSASTLCETSHRDGVPQLQVVENSEDIVNPIKWFGVLVPQNLHKAQSVFQNAINYVVECANVQLQLGDVMKKLELLRKLKE